MKKNKMMRLASAMMVMTLMTTSVISGTFAKYVTSDSATDVARVAKWGVSVTATDNSVFNTVYASDSEFVGNTVTSSTEEKLVAPGTKNTEGVTFAITGNPEVACKVSIEVNGLDDNRNISDTAEIKDVVLPAGTYSDMTTGDSTDTFTTTAAYYPVKYTLKQTTTTEGVEATSTVVDEGTLSDVVKALEAKSGEYAPQTDLATEHGTYTLTWAWAFEAGADDAEKKATDQKDTLLGNLAAGTVSAIAGASTDIKFGVKITVTQID